MVRAFCCLLFLLWIIPSFGQNDYSHPDYDALMDQHFPGGSKAFLELVFNNIQYPAEARVHGTMATLLTSFHINAKGSLDSLKFLNPVPIGDGIEEEVLRILKMTNKQWINCDEGFHADCSFVYKYENKE